MAIRHEIFAIFSKRILLISKIAKLKADVQRVEYRDAICIEYFRKNMHERGKSIFSTADIDSEIPRALSTTGIAARDACPNRQLSNAHNNIAQYIFVNSLLRSFINHGVLL